MEEATSEFGQRMNSMPKVVVSTTLTDPTWNNTTVISGNVSASPKPDEATAGYRPPDSSGQIRRDLGCDNLANRGITEPAPAAPVTIVADMTEPQLAATVGAGVNSRMPTRRGSSREQRPRWRSRIQPGRLLRRHWLVSILLAAGLVLRVLSMLAYHPALLYIDTVKYLYGVYPGADPLGYRLALRAILLVGNLGTVALVQHLLGLAIAVALYAVLLRRGCNRWLAALAVAPVLLDAYQLQMEQTIMPDVWFEALIAAGLTVLLWRPKVTLPFAVIAGLLLGSSATMRQVGEILIGPTLVYLLFANGGWRKGHGGGWRRAIVGCAALGVAFALPILLYSSVSYARNGHFYLATGQHTTGRMAAAADCATLKVPAEERALCPTPAQQALGPDYLEHSKSSPLHSNPLPPGAKRNQLIGALSAAVEHQQPQRVAVAILRDAVRLFAVTRKPSTFVTPISRWQFQAGYPVYPPTITVAPNHDIIIGLQRVVYGPFQFSKLRPDYGGKAQVNRPLASFLRSYQLDGGYTPGPLLALFALTGVLGSLLVLLRRRHPAAARSRQLALGCLLFAGSTVVVLLVPDVFEFSWRYQLPGLVTLPPAGVLGIGALLSLRKPREADAGEQLLSAPGPGPEPSGDAPQE
jgi:hypothetical protein